MTWFILTILLAYGSVHLYVFLRLRGALALHSMAKVIIVAFMLLMVTAPIGVHLLEGRGWERTAMLFSWIAYCWMGLVFLFFVASLVFDAYRCLIYVVQFLSTIELPFLLPSSRQLFWVPLVLASGVFLYACDEARSVRVTHLTIPSEKIPAPVGALRIVQISDVHIGLVIREARLRAIVREVVAAKPDLVVATGDLLDGQTDRIGAMADLFRAVQPRYGKYVIMGNHEYYAGFSKAHLFFNAAGFSLLRGEERTVADCLTLVGFDDTEACRLGSYRDVPRKYRRGRISNGTFGTFTLFLRHQPVIEDMSGRFDLQLSGHTHGGQIFPLAYVTELVFPMNSGLYRLVDRSLVYVSRGCGTWGPPIRFLAPPEITVIDLVHVGG